MDFPPRFGSMPWFKLKRASIQRVSSQMLALILAATKFHELNVDQYIIDNPTTSIFLALAFTGMLIVLGFEIASLLEREYSTSNFYKGLANNYFGSQLSKINGKLPGSSRVTLYYVGTHQSIGNKHYFYALGRYGKRYNDLKNSRTVIVESHDLVLDRIFRSTSSSGSFCEVSIASEIDVLIGTNKKMSRKKAWEKYWYRSDIDRSLINKTRMRPEWYCGIRFELSITPISS